MNGVQTRLKCKPNVKQCKRLVFPARSALFNHNILNTKAISHFQANHILIRFVFPPLYQVGNLYLLDITPFSHLREICELEDMNEWKTQLCVLGFLLLNIFLGVIGTFWFRTQQRRKEVALRMALGSSRRGIFSCLMYEGVLLLTLAAVPAAVIAFNIGYAELVDVGKMSFDAGRFLPALALTWLLMALMIVAGIWYPAYGAMKVHPAEALHDE